MDPARISIPQLIIAVVIVAGIETAIAFIAAPGGFASTYNIPALMLTGAARIAATALLLLLFYGRRGGVFSSIGLSASRLKEGINAGLIWSLAFGTIAGILAIGLFAAGIDPLPLVRVNLPDDPRRLVLFFLVGGLAAPVAEELFFRGVIYGFLRQRFYPALGKAGIVLAVVVSTLLFAGAHGVSGGLPLTQLAGGLVFAIAHERSGSLAAPVIIHASGNMALFLLSLLAA